MWEKGILSNPQITEGLNIREILQSNHSKIKEWLNHAKKYIQLYLDGSNKMITAEDIVGDILIKMVNGERNWNREKVDINAFMYNSIRSHVEAIAKKEKRTESTDKYLPETDSFESKFDDKLCLTLEAIYLQQDTKEKLAIVRNKLKDDEDCEIVFNCFHEGMNESEIAKDLGISKTDVRNIIRRIKYKIRKGLN